MREAACRSDLRSDAEDCADELALSYSIALGDPADLTFANSVVSYSAIVRHAHSTDRKPQARREAFP